MDRNIMGRTVETLTRHRREMQDMLARHNDELLALLDEPEFDDSFPKTAVRGA